MNALQYILVGLAPGLFWLFFMHRKDDHEPEPRARLLAVFVLGCASVWAILELRPLYQGLVPEETGLWQDFVDSFVVTALPEELVKLAAFVLGAWLWSEFDEPLDGVMYGIAAGLGFASAENVWFLFFTERLDVAFYRAFTSTLGHAAFSGAAGFFFALAKFGSRPRMPPLMAIGVAMAVVSHGLYDVFLIGDKGLELLSLLIVLPAGLVMLGLKIRWSRSRSPLFHPKQ